MKSYKEFLQEAITDSYQFSFVPGTDQSVAKFQTESGINIKLSTIDLNPPFADELEVAVIVERMVVPPESEELAKIYRTIMEFIYYVPGSGNANTITVDVGKRSGLDPGFAPAAVKPLMRKVGFSHVRRTRDGFELS